MQFSELLIKSFTKMIPKLQKLSTQLLNKHHLIVNYPLQLVQLPSQRYALQSGSKISKGNDLLLMAMSECIFSSGFTGASQREQQEIVNGLEQLSTQYESINKDFIQRAKIYIQILANSHQLKRGEMNLKNLSEYILSVNDLGLVKSNINSRFLMDLYQSSQISNKITFQYLKKELLKRVQLQEYVNACIKGRYFIRSAGDSHFLFIAPYLDKLDHSFNPNCQFSMLYMPHRRQPYIRIKAIRDIAQGEKPTINYGKLNNYQLLIRYGFSVKNNPNSIFMLPLNFQNILQIFNKNIEWKQKQFIINDLKLKNYVKILPSGEIEDKDLRMLRILICDSQKPHPQIVNQNSYDKHINNYIGQHARQMRKNIKINSLKVSSDQNIKNLQDEQITILDNFIKKHQN